MSRSLRCGALVLAAAGPAADLQLHELPAELDRVLLEVLADADGARRDRCPDRAPGQRTTCSIPEIPGTSHIIRPAPRGRGSHPKTPRSTAVCEFLQQYPVEFSRELVQLQVSGGGGGKDRAPALKERDDLYEPAVDLVVREGRGSVSLLQRALGIGYGRAARLIDFMAEDGIVGEFKAAPPAKSSTPGRSGRPSRTAASQAESAACMALRGRATSVSPAFRRRHRVGRPPAGSRPPVCLRIITGTRRAEANRPPASSSAGRLRNNQTHPWFS